MYFSTCLFVIPCSVDITLLELSNWSWILLTSFCTFSSLTSRLLAVDFAIFLTSFVLFTSVLQCFLEAFGLFPRLITNLSSLPFCLYCFEFCCGQPQTPFLETNGIESWVLRNAL